MDSRHKIMAAAMEVFAEKGKHGAPMEEIASRAKINKAMPYYFFTTKDNLYREVLTSILLDVHRQITDGVEAVTRKTKDPVEILKAIVNCHFDAYSRNMNYTKVLLEAFATQHDDVKVVIENLKKAESTGDGKSQGPEKMTKFLQKGIDDGVFRDIGPLQIMISIIGMNMVYFSARPISQMLIDGEVKNEKKFLEERKASIIDLLLYGIMKKRSA